MKSRQWPSSTIPLKKVSSGIKRRGFSQLWCRSKREKARKGKIVFYDPRIDLEENRERKALLELMDVKTVSFAGYGIEKEDYQEFYRRAVRDICDVVKERG